MKAKPNKQVVKYLQGVGASLTLVIAGGFLVAPWEGKVNKVYKDPVGILTSCYGHTGKELRMGQTFTDSECYTQLHKDLVKHEKEVLRLTHVPLNVYQQAALTSFVYNVGAGNYQSSTIRKKFNAKDYVGGCKELVKWVYASKVKLKGLVNRRGDELEVCLGDKPATDYINLVLEESK